MRFARYITEIAPASQRGMLVSMPQLMSVLGICLGYFTCYGSIHIGSSIAWRLPFILQVVTSIALAVSCSYLPTSPRWLYMRGLREEATQVFQRLDISSAEAEKDILGPAGQPPSAPSTSKGVMHIFDKQYRLRTMLGFFILGMVQLSGIDGVLYVSPISKSLSYSIAYGPFPAQRLFGKMVRTLVCPDSLHTGGTLKPRILLSRVWSLCHSHASSLGPCLLLR